MDKIIITKKLLENTITVYECDPDILGIIKIKIGKSSIFLSSEDLFDFILLLKEVDKFFLQKRWEDGTCWEI
ncbi:unnamed protein product [marine sediment metagenome]|uniref:Uncharacterized protein n=1 Tax=marine sediment metagenome TaxID=412755 RepID=X1PWL2_9ZZZZ